MQVAAELKPIGPFVKGQIVEYIEKQQARAREMLSLRRWHIVQVHAQQESSVAADIEQNGMAPYYPKVPHNLRVRAGVKHRIVWRPMYQGYIFAGFDPDGDLWHSIAQIEGVLRLFMINFRPVPLGHDEMRRIRDIEADRALGRCAKIPLAIKVGELIRVKDGPFASFFGFVTEIDTKERSLKVEMDIFGRKTPVQFEPEQVESA